MSKKVEKIHEVGRIYAIRSSQTDDIYIGSTFNTLEHRLSKHKFHYFYFSEKNSKYKCCSFEILKYPDCYIELIEEHYNLNTKQLRKIEGEHQRKTKCVNKVIAGRTHKEWLKDNDEAVKKQKNKKFNCECGGKYTACHRARHLKSPLHQNYINNK